METTDLSVSVSVSPQETIVTAAGEIDMSTVGNLTSAVDEQLAAHPARIVIDVAGITFCDSLGLGSLVVLNRRAQKTGTRLVLRSPSEFLVRMLQVTGVHQTLAVEDAV